MRIFYRITVIVIIAIVIDEGVHCIITIGIIARITIGIGVEIKIEIGRRGGKGFLHYQF